MIYRAFHEGIKAQVACQTKKVVTAQDVVVVKEDTSIEDMQNRKNCKVPTKLHSA